jgi:hypothetical protein
MGNFYTNIVIGGRLDEVVAALRSHGRDAYIGEFPENMVVVCDRKCDRQDLDELASLARTLSFDTGGPALAVLNHDDDFLLLGLYNGNGLVAEYGWSKIPQWGIPRTDRTAFVKRVRKAFGTRPRDHAPQYPRVPGILRTLSLWILTWIGARWFAIEVHGRLAAEMGMPKASVGAGFEYVARGETPEGADGFVHV